jgi:hypothetical protein
MLANHQAGVRPRRDNHNPPPSSAADTPTPSMAAGAPPGAAG